MPGSVRPLSDYQAPRGRGGCHRSNWGGTGQQPRVAERHDFAAHEAAGRIRSRIALDDLHEFHTAAGVPRHGAGVVSFGQNSVRERRRVCFERKATTPCPSSTFCTRSAGFDAPSISRGDDFTQNLLLLQLRHHRPSLAADGFEGVNEAHRGIVGKLLDGFEVDIAERVFDVAETLDRAELADRFVAAALELQRQLFLDVYGREQVQLARIWSTRRRMSRRLLGLASAKIRWSRNAASMYAAIRRSSAIEALGTIHGKCSTTRGLSIQFDS